jgi:putative endonuclease
MKDYFVYIMTNDHGNVMYVGVTNNLERRVFEHKSGITKGFSQKYNVKKLVYFEQSSSIEAAIAREKEIKKWRREKKNALVQAINPDFNDLSTT